MIDKEEIEEVKKCLKETMCNTYAEGKAKKLNTILQYISELETDKETLIKERDYYKERYLEFNNAFVQGGKKLTEEKENE